MLTFCFTDKEPSADLKEHQSIEELIRNRRRKQQVRGLEDFSVKSDSEFVPSLLERHRYSPLDRGYLTDDHAVQSNKQKFVARSLLEVVEGRPERPETCAQNFRDGDLSDSSSGRDRRDSGDSDTSGRFTGRYVPIVEIEGKSGQQGLRRGTSSDGQIGLLRRDSMDSDMSGGLGMYMRNSDFGESDRVTNDRDGGFYYLDERKCNVRPAGRAYNSNTCGHHSESEQKQPKHHKKKCSENRHQEDLKSSFGSYKDNTNLCSLGRDSTSLCSPGRGRTSLCSQERGKSSLCSPGRDSFTLCLPGRGRTSLCSPEGDSPSLCSSGRDRTSLCSPGRDNTSLCSPGRDNTSLHSPGRDNTSLCSPGSGQPAATSITGNAGRGTSQSPTVRAQSRGRGILAASRRTTEFSAEESPRALISDGNSFITSSHNQHSPAVRDIDDSPSSPHVTESLNPGCPGVRDTSITQLLGKGGSSSATIGRGIMLACQNLRPVSPKPDMGSPTPTSGSVTPIGLGRGRGALLYNMVVNKTQSEQNHSADTTDGISNEKLTYHITGNKLMTETENHAGDYGECTNNVKTINDMRERNSDLQPNLGHTCLSSAKTVDKTVQKVKGHNFSAKRASNIKTTEGHEDFEVERTIPESQILDTTPHGEESRRLGSMFSTLGFENFGARPKIVSGVKHRPVEKHTGSYSSESGSGNESTSGMSRVLTNMTGQLDFKKARIPRETSQGYKQHHVKPSNKG